MFGHKKGIFLQLYKMYIYKITNEVNSKFYIGKTKKTPVQRFKEHYYLSKKSDTHFHRAIRKHGIENFKVEIIEKISEQNNLNEKEKYWIEKLKPNYNKTIGGEGVVGYTYTKTHKLNMSLAKKGKKNTKTHNLNISLGKIGKKQSSEHVQKRMLAKKNKPISVKTREKISKANKNRPKSKNVCRIYDKTLMNVANFVCWLNKQKN